jgi:hypothetical protein
LTDMATSGLTALHDSTTVLLEETDDLGQVLLDLLLVIHLLCSLLLLLVVLLVALLLGRVSLLLMALVSKRVGSLVLGLSVVRLVVLLRLTIASRRYSCSTSEVDVHSTFILLGMVLEALLLADLLNTRLDLLNVVDRVIALADDAASTIRGIQIAANLKDYSHMQMVLAGTLCVLDSLFQNLFGLFNELTVKVNGITVDSAYSIVLAEDELGCLSVVVVCLLSVVLGFLGEIVGSTSISTRVCFLRLGGAVLALTVFLSRKISQSVVLGFGVARLLVIEG